MRHGRSPCVKHGGDADLCAEVLRVGRNRHHGLCRSLEQQIIDQRLVGKGNGGNLGRQGKHDVEVSDRQQIGFARCQPCARRTALAPGAVPVTTRVVGDPPVPATGAGLDMAAQRSGPAMLDR